MAHQWGRFSWRSAVAIMPQASATARGLSRVNERRLHPTRIRTPAVPASKGRRGCTEASRSSAWPDAHSFPQSRPFKVAGSSHDRMSRWCVLGCGADADRYGPRRFRWAGECVASGTSVSHRVSSGRPLAVQHFWDWPHGHEPVSASPVLRLRRFIPRTFTWVKTLRPPPGGFLVLAA